MTKRWILRRDDLMTVEEWAKLRIHLRTKAQLAERRGTKTALRNETVIHTALATGLRRSEIAALNVGDLRLCITEPYVIVRRGKGGGYREVPLSPRCRTLLERYLRLKQGWGEPLGLDDPVFLGERGRYTGGGINRLFKRSCAAAGLRDTLHVHSARHFVGRELYRATRDVLLVRNMLGHARASTTEVYVQVTDDRIQDGLAQLDAVIAGKRGAESRTVSGPARGARPALQLI